MTAAGAVWESLRTGRNQRPHDASTLFGFPHEGVDL